MDVERAGKAASDAGVSVLSGLTSLTGLAQGHPRLAAVALAVLLLDAGSKVYVRIQAARTERERAAAEREQTIKRGELDDGHRHAAMQVVLSKAEQGNAQALDCLAKVLGGTDGTPK